MDNQQIYDTLTEIFRDVFDNDTLVVGPQTTADDVDGWDSQAHVTLIVATEMRFGLRFRTAELELLHNVADFVRLIREKQEKKAS